MSPSVKPVKEKTDLSANKALQAEGKLKSDWFIIDLAGELHPLTIKDGKVTGYDFIKHPNLGKFAQYEMAKNRVADKEPDHVRLMRKQELVDYESGSDSGNLRYPPKGRLIKSLLEQWVTQAVIDYGGMEIESPIMYDFEHPALKDYLNRFPARQYIVESPDKKLFLRFAACFGQFLMAHDAVISYRNLPFKLYELTRYSFRAEKSGELTGLRRLRAFTMPDCHALCADIEQAKAEMLKRLDLAKKVVRGIGFDVPGDFELALRVVKKDMWEPNKEFIVKMVNVYGKPALLEMWDERPFYFIFKYELNFVDNMDKASALVTDQFDVENAERYDLNYVDKDGLKKKPIILHLSPSGAIERVMYALLEKQARIEAGGGKPQYPVWLAPVQVRLCPVNGEFNDDALKLVDELINGGVRADLDDRDERIGKKIRDAELEWVPFIIVYGEKEKGKDKLGIRQRDGSTKEFSIKELINLIGEERGEKPNKKLSLPKRLSERPIFIG